MQSQNEVVADLHLHSKYSRAVSQNMEIPEMSRQAARKGIQLLATADWTHPLWIYHLQNELEEWSEGIYQSHRLPSGAKFVLSTELSCIFSQGGRVRRVHVLVMVPSIAVALAVNKELTRRHANLHADGRPMLGMSCMEICEVALTADPRSLVIPAHAWTPWFGVYGSKGGFDSLAEAFGPFAKNIFAIETGLSSDPAMNWQVGELDTRAIVSFSDAHSPAKMGRELTVFTNISAQYTYADLYAAIAERTLQQNSGSLKLSHTIEFYPEEGKYHWDGHRACNVAQSPADTRHNGVTCPVCGKPLTVGVEYRVQELTTTNVTPESIVQKPNQHQVIFYHHPSDTTRASFVKLVPLQEIIADVEGKGTNSLTVQRQYDELLDKVGTELHILMEATELQLQSVTSSEIAAAILQVRRGQLKIEPGYDGVYGKVKIHGKKTAEVEDGQVTLF